MTKVLRNHHKRNTKIFKKNITRNTFKP